MIFQYISATALRAVVAFIGRWPLSIGDAALFLAGRRQGCHHMPTTKPRLKEAMSNTPCRFASVAALLLASSLAVAAPAVILAERPAPVCGESGWVAPEGKRLKAVDIDAVVASALASDVVLLGEQHSDEDHHRWQLQMLAALHARRPDMVIGFEMFPRRVQAALDQWVAGQLTVGEFLERTEWAEVWRHPPHIYLPLFEFARINRIPMLALNVDRKLTRAVTEKGWAGVAPAEREGVGRPAPATPPYLRFLRDIHRLHAEPRNKAGGRPETPFDNFLDTQLTWDRAMAEALASRLQAADGRRPPLAVGIMGSGHIRFGHGVPHQLRDLGVRRIATLLPVSGKAECQDLQAGIADAAFLLPDKPHAAPEPPRLGVTLEDGEKSVRIVDIMPGSLAERSGLRAGDRIVELAGKPVTGTGEAIAAIQRQPPGTWLPLRVLRQEGAVELVIRFPARP